MAVVYLPTVFFFRETYGPVIQARKRAYHAQKEGITSPRNFMDELKIAWSRPFKLLLKSPVLPLLGLFTAVTNSYAQICFATLGTTFQDIYGFSPGQSGLAYVGLTVGFLFSQATMGRFSDRHIKKMEARHGDMKAEHRLPPIFIGTLVLPVGLFWYGWTLQNHTHWIVPIVGSAFIAIGILYTYLPVQLYIVDVYTVYAASATGACTIIRSMCSALIPLGANPLYLHLGYGWGNSLLAFIALGFVSVAAFLIKYGERIRTHPRFQPEL